MEIKEMMHSDIETRLAEIDDELKQEEITEEKVEELTKEVEDLKAKDDELKKEAEEKKFIEIFFRNCTIQRMHSFHFCKEFYSQIFRFIASCCILFQILFYTISSILISLKTKKNRFNMVIIL